MEYLNTRARRCVNIQGEIPESFRALLLERAMVHGISRSEVVRELLDAGHKAVESGYLPDYAPDRRDGHLVHVNFTVWGEHVDYLQRLRTTLGVSGSAALRIGLATGWAAPTERQHGLPMVAA